MQLTLDSDTSNAICYRQKYIRNFACSQNVRWPRSLLVLPLVSHLQQCALTPALISERGGTDDEQTDRRQTDALRSISARPSW